MIGNRAEIGFRLGAWGCIGLIAILSLLPADEMIRTSLGGHAEHATAYAGAALLMQLGYFDRGRARVALALVAYAGLLEWLQHFAPGRNPAFEDWLASSVGALIGSGVAHRVGRSLKIGVSPAS